MTTTVRLRVRTGLCSARACRGRGTTVQSPTGASDTSVRHRDHRVCARAGRRQHGIAQARVVDGDGSQSQGLLPRAAIARCGRAGSRRVQLQRHAAGRLQPLYMTDASTYALRLTQFLFFFVPTMSACAQGLVREMMESGVLFDHGGALAVKAVGACI